MSKTTIKQFNVDWMNIKNLCRQTISMGDSSKEPTQEWKRKLLIARHSPLRAGTVQWQWPEIPFYVMGHFVRHVHAIPFVGTSRSDRTGVPREERKQTDDVTMQMIANVEELQHIAEKRLCYQADKTTREYAEDLKKTIRQYDEDVAWSLVPSCVRCGGCIEKFGNCQFYTNLMKDHTLEEQQDITKRYDIYDEYITGRSR